MKISRLVNSLDDEKKPYNTFKSLEILSFLGEAVPLSRHVEARDCC